MIKITFLENKICLIVISLSIALLGYFSLHAQGVAQDPMRGLSKNQFVNNMKFGWNLGNTMDATSGGETGWGNPVTTQAMIDMVAQKGFKTLRIPVTWQGHFGGSPNYTIDATWLARVVTIANYGLKDSMYVIVNTHHDGTSGGWYNLGATGEQVTTTSAEVAAIWTQIANAFKNYSDYVVFEIFNEPQNGAANQYGGGDATSRANLATYQLAAVNAIRATGGNNATRMIMLQGISASPIAVSVGTIPIPDSSIIVSIHTYDPGGFSLNCNPTTWGSSSDSSSMRNGLKGLQNMVAAKGGVGVVGEWGSEACDDLASRVKHAYYYAQQCRLHAMAPIWWDNGVSTGSNFGLLNRKGLSWYYPTIVQAIIDGFNSATFPAEIKTSNHDQIVMTPGLSVKTGIIGYTLPQPSSVSLRMYTMQGKIISTFFHSKQSAGKYEVPLPTKVLSPGSYLLEFKAGKTMVTKRINSVGN